VTLAGITTEGVAIATETISDEFVPFDPFADEELLAELAPLVEDELSDEFVIEELSADELAIEELSADEFVIEELSAEAVPFEDVWLFEVTVVPFVPLRTIVILVLFAMVS